MTVRSIPAKPRDYHAKSGLVVPCKSILEWHFCTYLDLFWPAQAWTYEPVTLRDPAGGYRPDIRVMTEPVVWVEVKYNGFLDSPSTELTDAMRKLELLRRHRPRDRIALMPWGYDWTAPQVPFLLDAPRGWNLVQPTTPVRAERWQVPA